MKNLQLAIAFCGLATTPLALTDSNPVKPFLKNQGMVNSVTENNVSATFTIRPADNTKATNMDEVKVAHAQQIADELFKVVEKDLIVAGKSEEQLNKEITELARGKFGVEKHWHKKIVRAGVNTLAIYPDNPPNRVIQTDDIVIIDFGIVVEGWESDYARTYVLGNDARKMKLKKDVVKAWYETQEWFHKQTHVKASDLFAFTRKKSKEYGWTSAGEIAGHIVGKYPHEQPADPKSLELDVHPDNSNDMFLLDASGNKRHWILEIHFVDTENNIGGYFEQLL